MKMNKKTLDLLYRSFDEDLEDKEQKQLAEALENSKELRREKEQIDAQRRALYESAVRTFKPFFAERVMNRILSPEKKAGVQEVFYESLRIVFRRFAIGAVIVLMALISYNLIKGDILHTDEVYYASDITIEEISQLPLF